MKPLFAAFRRKYIINPAGMHDVVVRGFGDDPASFSDQAMEALGLSPNEWEPGFSTDPKIQAAQRANGLGLEEGK